ncbi:CAAD domain-containing protein [Gloeocapsa sp. PCC 73106]|uniref:CAAD domain-containing protein n=1 Tax=Gloeocapsa sp. PCC 73106 TaxID=102232 RepID=UPI0002ACAB89|nr:CAAD domain-containing protein [Gloeocapsa sp. PCC 73106]ELR98668.1 hypothetical protein GLO73106DRAFT_00025060 [Gloeocapsa sp. PCC 73106]
MESNPPEQEPKLKDMEQVGSGTTPVQTAPGKLAPGNSTSLNLNTIKDQPWQEWVDMVFDVLAKIPVYVGNFFSDYRQPLVTLLLIASGAVTVYITLAVLDAIDDIPLLSPILKLLGLGYSAWFVYRYLWKAENRQELWQEFEAFKSQIVGRDS